MTSVLAPIYSARDSAITQRMASTALLAIDSEDRFRNYEDERAPLGINRSPYSFAITKEQSLMNGAFTRIALTELVFPWVIPNINSSTNLMNVVWNGATTSGSQVISMDIGFHTPAMIASELQAIIRALDPVALGAFTMTYGINTAGGQSGIAPIFEYKTNNPTTGILFSPVAPSQVPGAPISLRRKQLFDILGFSDLNSTSFQAVRRGRNTYCQATRYVDIVCTQLTSNQALKDSMSQPVARDVLCRVYIGDAQGVQSTVLPTSASFCPPGCMPTTIYKNYATPKQIQWIPNQPIPGYLQFDVYDDAGEPLINYIGAGVVGTDWSMSMLVTEN